MSDSLHFDLTGVPLAQCFDIAFTAAPKQQAAGWLESDTENGHPRLTLFWTDNHIDIARFPAPLGAEAAVHVVAAWLDQVKYGPRPNTDGSTKKGWRVCSPGFQPWQAFVAIEPVWLVYGK